VELRYRVLPSLPGPEPGPGVDVSVDLGPGATVGDLAEALTTALGRVADHTPPLHRPTIRTIGPNGVTLAPGFAAATSAPPSGSSVTVVEADDSPTAPPLRAPVTLEPLRRVRPGNAMTLCYGSNPMAPGADGLPSTRSTDVAASIHVGCEVRVVNTGSTHRVEVDGSPVLASASARSGTLLRVGDHLWAVRVLGDLRPPDNPPVRVHDGHRLVWPSPGDIDDRNESVVVPAPPSDRRPPGFPVLSTAVPLLLGLGAWWVTGSWTLAGFMAASVIYVIASALEARREVRRDRRASAAAFEERLRAAGRELTERAEAWRDRSRRACPDGDDLIQLGPAPAWTRAGARLDLTVRLGTRHDRAPVPVRLDDAAGTAADDGRVERAVRAALEGPFDVTIDLDAEGTVALVGPDEVADGLARSIVVQLAGLVPPDDLEVTAILGPERRHAWRWIDWLPHAHGGGSGGRTARRLVIVDGRDAPARREAVARSGARPRDVRLWLSPGQLGVPADIGAVVTLEPGDRSGAVTASLRRPRRTPVDFAPPALDHDDAEAIARHWAAFAPSTAVDRLGPGPTLADVVTTSGSFDDAAACAERWRGSDGSLAVPIGTSDGGVLVVDLRRDGPHTLVAGTTGSGKSELLRTVLASAALHHPPTAVQFLLVDYKGGTAFGDLVDLPHTVGLVTDLDEALGGRVVVSLRAELRHRERAQRAGRSMPALLVVVDEFATLSRELPSFVDEIVDVAQRGRSLGLHLVLATQRPAGVVTDAIRANTSLRIALRVADPDDSRDVVGSAAAAELDRSLPGSAVVRIGSSDARRFRVAHSGGRSAGGRRPVAVRPLHEGDRAGPDPGAPERDAPGATQLRAAVTAAATAADNLGLPAPRRPWRPPLDDHVALVLPGHDRGPGPATGSTSGPICIGLVDRPDLQRIEELVIDLWRDGGVVVTGASGSGRSTALASIAAAATALGTAVHAIDTSRSLVGLLGPGVDVVDGDDPDRTLRMLRRLAGPTEGRGPVLLLVDDWHALRDRHERVNRGEALGIVSTLATTGRRDGLRLAVSSLRTSDLPLELTAASPHHLRLRPTSSDEGFHAAGPPGSVGPGTPPGRGVVDGHLVQVAVPPPPHRWATGTATPTPALPRSVPPGDLPPPNGWRVAIGLRAADLTPARVDLSDSHLLVIGSRRSGRTTLLEHLAVALGSAAPGRPVLRVDGRRADAPLRAAALHAHLGQLLDRDRRDHLPRTLVVIDDLDDLLESELGPDATGDPDGDSVGAPPIPTAAAFDDRLCAALRRPDRCCVVAAVDADGVGRCYAESPRLLRSNRRALLVDPDAEVHAALVHAALPPHDELPRGPGSIWLVDGGRCVPVRGVDPL
jgi:S-DNA-T family DNA segregation ATPase FtsK/SpoIIIE